jgi:subtilase family serine protease
MRNLITPDETFGHIFYECPNTNSAINNFLSKFLPDVPPWDNASLKNFLFTGANPFSGLRDNFFFSTLAIVILFSIWDSKLQKNLPNGEKIANDVFHLMENIRRASTAMRNDMLNNLLLCRNWSDEVNRRH